MAPRVSGAVSTEQAPVSLFTFVDAEIASLLLLIKIQTPKAFFPKENIEAKFKLMGQSDWDHIMLKHRTHHQLIAVELETDDFRSVQVISNCQPCYHPSLT